MRTEKINLKCQLSLEFEKQPEIEFTVGENSLRTEDVKDGCLFFTTFLLMQSTD